MIRIALPTALLPAALLLCACAATTAAEPPADRADRPIEGPVGLGQTAFVDGPHVRPDQVIEDSRCPIDVRCVWAGRLIVRATVTGGAWSKVLDLELGKPVQVADGALTLTGATPDRTVGKGKGKPQPYRFSFAFKGGY